MHFPSVFMRSVCPDHIILLDFVYRNYIWRSVTLKAGDEMEHNYKPAGRRLGGRPKIHGRGNYGTSTAY